MQTLKLAMAIIVAVAVSALLLGPAAAQATQEISATGVGSAVVGSTAAQLRTQLGPEYTVDLAGEVLVDVKGYEVRKNGDLVFVAAAVTGTDDLLPSEPLDIFIVRDEGPTTADGLGVGTTISEGVAIYGDATLSYNVESESREFVQFDNQPDWLSLRTGSGPTAGIYPADAEGPFFETTVFNPDAPITSVWVQCSRSGCPAQPTLPRTGAAHTRLAALGVAAIAIGAACIATERRPTFV